MGHNGHERPNFGMIHLKMGFGFTQWLLNGIKYTHLESILMEIAIVIYMSLVKGKKLTAPTTIYIHYVSPLKGPCNADSTCREWW